MGAQFPIWCARLRMPLLWVAVAFLVGGAFLGWPAWMGLAGLVLLVAGLALYFRVGTVRRPPVEVAAPVAGRWQALNSRPTRCRATACTPTGRPTPSTWCTSRPAGPGPSSAAARRSGRPPTTRPSASRSWHFQLMDHRSVLFAAGLPFRLDRFEVDGDVQAGVPANGQPFTTSPPREAAEDRR